MFKKVDKKFYLYSGDILIAMTGANIGKIGLVPKTNLNMLLNQRVGKVVSEYIYLLFFILNSSEIQGAILGNSSSGSAQGNISNSDIENFIYLVPNIYILGNINIILEKYYKRIIFNLGEIENITKIRDSLLPKLMSGEIRVG
jgi:type I restriction enzyme S subunit